MEAAAQKRENRRRLRRLYRDGRGGGLLSDCGDPAQRRGRLHPHGTARSGNAHPSDWLLVVCLINSRDELKNKREADEQDPERGESRSIKETECVFPETNNL